MFRNRCYLDLSDGFFTGRTCGRTSRFVRYMHGRHDFQTLPHCIPPTSFLSVPNRLPKPTPEKYQVNEVGQSASGSIAKIAKSNEKSLLLTKYVIFQPLIFQHIVSNQRGEYITHE